MALEMSRVQQGLVSAPRPLGDLLMEEAPAARTRGGDEHRFDPQMLRRFADALGPLARRKLRLPATFFVDKDLAEDAYLADEAAAELLRALGEVPRELEMRDGRLWLAHARARDIAERHRGAFQFSYL